MDSGALVDYQIDDGQRYVTRLVLEGITLSAAFWAKPLDVDRWELYIASPLVDQKGSEAYTDFLAVFRSLGKCWMDSSVLTFVGENQRIARYVRQVQEQFPEVRHIKQTPIGVPAEEIYIYPLKGVSVPIFGLVYQNEPSGALHLSFDRQDENSKLLIGGKEYPAKTHEWKVAAPASAKLEPDQKGLLQLIWPFRGVKTHSDANEALSLAHLGLHGFRILEKPREFGNADSSTTAS